MTNRTFPLSFVLSAFVLLVAGCSGDVYDGQAALYDEYKEKLDTVSSYESIKKLNTELNAKMVAYVKSNSEDIVQFHKEAAKHKEGVSTLVKAESDYVKAYLNKVMGYLLKQQTDLYTEYTEKVNAAQGYDELVKLNNSLSGAVSRLGNENKDEFKKAAALNICQEQFTALNKAGEAFRNTYTNKIAPCIFPAEAEIYNKYLDKLRAVNGYKELKQVKLFLDKELLLFNNANSMVTIAPDAYLSDKEAVAKVKNAFQSAYMQKVAMPTIEYQKNLYSGTAELFATVKDAAELKALKADFLLVNKQFLTENEAELEYIATEIAAGNTVYRREMEVVKSLFRALE